MIKMDAKSFDKSTIKDLKKYYDYIYTCEECKKKYGSIEKETPPLLCPVCELKIKEKNETNKNN